MTNNHGLLILSPRLNSGSQQAQPQGVRRTATTRHYSRFGPYKAATTKVPVWAALDTDRPRTAHAEATVTAHAGEGI